MAKKPLTGKQPAGGTSTLHGPLIGQDVIPATDDPAFQPPTDPLADYKATRVRAQRIDREIPNLAVQTGWSISNVRAALQDLTTGLFNVPAQLHDAIAADSRVQSAMRSRSSGLIGQPVRFTMPRRFRDDPRAKKCLRAWEAHWPQMTAEPALVDILETANSLGNAPGQLLWDTSKEIWKPYIQSFNARFTWYNWIQRSHIAITRDGQVAITPGDGHWLLHSPYGSYRGWMRGAIRAVAQWWLARNYALRDWARYSERHGFPILLADTPFGADPTDILAYQTQLVGIGQESVLQLPGGPDAAKYGKYDLRYLEPADASWLGFKELINQCNDEITLALLGQNLTTQVKEGSFAAARVHADVKQTIIQADARSLARTVYMQIARPFAAVNFGNADLAPMVEWDVRPQEDLKAKASTFQSFAFALQNMRLAGYHVKDVPAFAKSFGLKGLDVEVTQPLQVEAKLATADASSVEDAESKKDTNGKEDEDQD